MDQHSGDGETIVIKYRDQPGRVYIQFIDKEGSHLGIAVLLDYKYFLVVLDKIGNGRMEREGPDPAQIEMDSLLFEQVGRFQG